MERERDDERRDEAERCQDRAVGPFANDEGVDEDRDAEDRERDVGEQQQDVVIEEGPPCEDREDRREREQHADQRDADDEDRPGTRAAHAAPSCGTSRSHRI